MNLQQVRDLVRAQLDMPDEADLATTLIDTYIREGFDRTIASERWWPFFESTWSISNAGGTETIDLPTDAEDNAITSLSEVGAYRLTQIAPDYADAVFTDVQQPSRPAYYSIWSNKVYLWPKPNVERQYRMRGYRKPTDWVSSGASATADGDTRLHPLYAWYACSLAFAQQEDEVLEAVYLARWERGLADIKEQIMAPSHNHPLIMAGGMSSAVNRARWVWDLP